MLDAVFARFVVADNKIVQVELRPPSSSLKKWRSSGKFPLEVVPRPDYNIVLALRHGDLPLHPPKRPPLTHAGLSDAPSRGLKDRLNPRL